MSIYPLNEDYNLFYRVKKIDVNTDEMNLNFIPIIESANSELSLAEMPQHEYTLMAYEDNFLDDALQGKMYADLNIVLDSNWTPYPTAFFAEEPDLTMLPAIVTEPPVTVSEPLAIVTELPATESSAVDHTAVTRTPYSEPLAKVKKTAQDIVQTLLSYGFDDPVSVFAELAGMSSCGISRWIGNGTIDSTHWNRIKQINSRLNDHGAEEVQQWLNKLRQIRAARNAQPNWNN